MTASQYPFFFFVIGAPIYGDSRGGDYHGGFTLSALGSAVAAPAARSAVPAGRVAVRFAAPGLGSASETVDGGRLVTDAYYNSSPVSASLVQAQAGQAPSATGFTYDGDGRQIAAKA